MATAPTAPDRSRDAEVKARVPDEREATTAETPKAPPHPPGFSIDDLPRRFGRYTLLRRLAKGGMGEVLLGATMGLEGAERPVIIKMIRSEHRTDASFKARFLRLVKRRVPAAKTTRRVPVPVVTARDRIEPNFDRPEPQFDAEEGDDEERAAIAIQQAMTEELVRLSQGLEHVRQQLIAIDGEEIPAVAPDED